MSPRSILSLILPLTLCLFLHQFSYVKGENPLIQKVCRTTPYYDLCVTTLLSDKTSEKSDTKGLVDILVKHAEATASSTYAYIASNATAFGSAGELCEYHYKSAGQALQESIKDMGNGGFDSAERKTSEAREEAKTCGTEFARFGMGYPKEMAKREVLLEQLCDSASYIISSLMG